MFIDSWQAIPLLLIFLITIYYQIIMGLHNYIDSFIDYKRVKKSWLSLNYLASWFLDGYASWW